MIVPDNLDWRGKKAELHTFVFRVMHFLGARGQLVARAAIDDHRGFRSEPFGGADRVHRHVAAANDRDALAVKHRSIGVRKLIRGHQVDAREVLIGRVNAFKILARNVHEDRQPRAVRDEHGIEAHVQFRERVRAADNDVALNLHACGFQSLDFLRDNVFRQAKFRNAIDQHAAGFVERFVNRDFVAEADEFPGCGQARGP